MRHEIDEPIEVVAYDARWPAWFIEDAAEVRQCLGSSIDSVDHFGSTSVPNLTAKPIIDVLVALVSWPLLGTERLALEALGYEYFGEAGVPGREYLRRRASHATNLAVVARGSSLVADNLAVRDYLISHPEVARSYGDLKQAVWSQGARALLEFSRGKHEFVDRLLLRARAWRDRR